jgi:hypothetical protein
LLDDPPAIDFHSNRLIESRVSLAKPVSLAMLVAVEEADALAFACNAVNVANTVILNQASAGLRQRLGPPLQSWGRWPGASQPPISTSASRGICSTPA